MSDNCANMSAKMKPLLLPDGCSLLGLKDHFDNFWQAVVPKLVKIQSWPLTYI